MARKPLSQIVANAREMSKRHQRVFVVVELELGGGGDYCFTSVADAENYAGVEEQVVGIAYPSGKYLGTVANESDPWPVAHEYGEGTY